MSISDRLDEIAARCDAATEGPWYAERRNENEPYELTTVYNVFHNGDTADRDLVAEVAYDNAEFIAASRTDVPALVAALRAVLDVCEKSELGMYPEPRYDEYIPGQLDTAERIRNAINATLGEEA